MKRTFQKGNHLWTIESAGKRVTTTWGVVGGKMQTKPTAHGSPDAARAFLQTQARLKLRAGHAETTFRGELPLSDPIAQGLIEALTENPDDMAAHMAFADWLSEQADDRLTAWGEFMRLQLALEQTPTTGKRKTPDARRIAELQDAYEMHWLGEDLAIPLLGMGTDGLYHHSGQTRRYVRGWLDSLALVGLDKSLARAMANPTALRLLRTLEISDLSDLFEHCALAPLAKSSVLGNVQHLSFAAYGSDSALNGLIRSMPRLKSLRLAVSDLSTSSLFAMPSLSSLDTLEVLGPSQYYVKKLAANPALANLRRLALNTVMDLDDDIDDDPGYLGDADIRAICHSPHLKGLKELALHWIDTSQVEAWRPFVTSGILARLELLDLTGGDLDEHSIEVFAACPDFARIPRVILDENLLAPEMVRRLRRINKGVKADDQRDPFGYDYDDFDDEWE